MRELRFRKDLYDVAALDATMQVFASHAAIERTEEADVMVVRIAAQQDFDEDELAGEFGNYVLGATIDRATSQGGAR